MSLNLQEITAKLGMVIIPSEAFPFVTGASLAMRALERIIADVAPTDVPILVIGENGTGKEIVALEVHRRSRNFDKPFVKCHCGSLVSDALRMHLADGATTRRELPARNSTTFFDDISRLDAANQNILLQFLSDNSCAPESHFLPHRVISSTTSDLEAEMRAGRFRKELYYRINGVCLRLPALRERQEDLPLLLDHFLEKYASSFERSEPQLSSTAMEVLWHHPWPGNVRELQNFARKLVILGDEELALNDLVLGSAPNATEAGRGADLNNHVNKARSLKAAAREASRNVERELILDSLERTHWNRKRTARELQISYKALLYKLKQLHIEGVPNLAQEPAQGPGQESRS